MNVVRVWDALNGEERDAMEYETTIPLESFDEMDAVEAAERYAEEDVDGNVDGIYDGGHPIRVRAGQRVFNVLVHAEPSVVFRGVVDDG